MKPVQHIARALIVALALGAAAPAVAHPEGHGPQVMTVDKSVAEARAKSVVRTLIDRDTVEASWATINPTSAQLRAGRDGLEWVVLFENPKVRDPAKRKLYVFLTADGGYLAANHTGR